MEQRLNNLLQRVQSLVAQVSQIKRQLKAQEDRNDFIIDLLTEKQLEELMEYDRDADSNDEMTQASFEEWNRENPDPCLYLSEIEEHEQLKREHEQLKEEHEQLKEVSEKVYAEMGMERICLLYTSDAADE